MRKRKDPTQILTQNERNPKTRHYKMAAYAGWRKSPPPRGGNWERMREDSGKGGPGRPLGRGGRANGQTEGANRELGSLVPEGMGGCRLGEAKNGEVRSGPEETRRQSVGGHT